MEESLPRQARKLEKYIYNLPAARKLNMLSSAPREAMIKLRDSITSAHGAVVRYYASEDTHEQVQELEEAIRQLTEVDKYILIASQYDLLDVTDVAHLSALNEHIIEQLK